jgi:TorA maturation chaperone TorD
MTFQDRERGKRASRWRIPYRTPLKGAWGWEGRAQVQATGQITEPIAEEDRQRALAYGMLARVLAAPPNAEMLEGLGRITTSGPPSSAATALDELAAAARRTTPAALDDEYHALFIGVSGGELNPFGSYYLTGFMYEKPLAHLRGDMARLGIARRDEVKEPEDHIAMLCEMMAGLITGELGDAPASLVAQQAFFDAHLGSWAPRFFEDLETAEAAQFYRAVGKIGRLFMEIEQQAFAMAA